MAEFEEAVKRVVTGLEKKNQFLIPNQEGSGDYSAITAHLIDKEIRQIIDEQHKRDLEILKSKRDILNQAAETILESETIQGEELEALEEALLKQSDLTDDTDVPVDRQAMAA
jgi:cell division protease FtsH